ncbi:MAG: Por secretion system protein [Bacteroidaceae bacterium]|nr:Por secretion system protein [Bacteroidaceae bacterium]
MALVPFSLFSTNVNAEDSDWKIYASYHHPTKAIKIGSLYYTLANGDISKGEQMYTYNNLYVFDEEDESLGIYDKSNALSDHGIYDIAYSKETHSLIILYTNGNIDIMNMNGGVHNLPEFKNKSFQDKTINCISIAGNKAYISLNIGLVVINMKDYYYENLYQLNDVINDAKISQNKIFALTSKGSYVGNKKDNLLDKENWTFLTNEELKDDEEYANAVNENVNDTSALNKVSKYIPDSPLRNYAYKLHFVGDRLLVSGGNWYYPESTYKGTAMWYEDERWKAFDEKEISSADKTKYYKNITDIAQDPYDVNHHFLSSKGGGLFEFKNFKLIKHYTLNNSPLRSIIKNNDQYLRIDGLQYDKDGNLWMLNSAVDTIIHILTKDEKWISYVNNSIKRYPNMDKTMIDSKGYVWVNSRRTTNYDNITGVASKAGVLIINTNGTINTQKDDEEVFIADFKNQDGTQISPSPDIWWCATEDIDGAVWIGNDRGLFVAYDTDKLLKGTNTLNQIKIARNDGTNLADYLLSGVEIKCIAVDGGNRKWIGTATNGVYLISADGQEIIEHFTKDNSPLISDNINDIAINGKTGEVFFATYMGLCSYMGDATDPSDSMDDSTLKVYPNPVRPEYNGDVKVTGLMYNSDVRVVSAAGKLVYTGKSEGGMFTWNCCYESGKKCGSGIFYILCTDENGKEGACAKILIVR